MQRTENRHEIPGSPLYFVPAPSILVHDGYPNINLIMLNFHENPPLFGNFFGIYAYFNRIPAYSAYPARNGRRTIVKMQSPQVPQASDQSVINNVNIIFLDIR